MGVHPITVRLDAEDHELLSEEASRLGVRVGTLARMLIRSTLRPGGRALAIPPQRGPAEPSLADPSLRERILGVAARHGARNVRVFGSRARGGGGPGSDVDLLVEMEPGRGLLDLVALSQELEELVGRRVDVVTDGGVSSHLRDRVYAEAVPL